MKTKEFKSMTFYFKPESIIMSYHNQFIAFHSYKHGSSKKLKSFGEHVMRSRKMEISDVFTIAKRHKVPCMSVTSGSLQQIGDSHKKKVIW